MMMAAFSFGVDGVDGGVAARAKGPREAPRPRPLHGEFRLGRTLAGERVKANVVLTSPESSTKARLRMLMGLSACRLFKPGPSRVTAGLLGCQWTA